MFATDLISRKISRGEMAFLRNKARNAMIGGVSNIRNENDRREELETDQLIGIIGHYAFVSIYFGSSQPFLVQRWYAEHNKYQGDISDVPGANIDVKSSRLNQERPVLTHSLIVRQKEFSRETIYVLVLVSISQDGETAEAEIVGWIHGRDMPQRPNTEGIFAGAYSVVANRLNPVMPVRWYL